MSLIFRGLSVGTSGGGGGGSANLETLDVTPTTSAQSILPNTGYDGFSLVNVSAVNSSIDANISSENIRNGCEILGVTGTAQTPNINLGIRNTSGRYNVTSYNRISVAIPQESPIKYGATIDTFLGDIVNGEYPVYNATPADIELPAGIDAIGSFFSYKFYNSSTINSITSEASTAGNNAFVSAFKESSIRYANFYNMTSTFNNSFNTSFYNCQNFESANFSSLTTANNGTFYRAFAYCNNLTNINFNSLKEAYADSFYYSFLDCSNLSEITFNSLTTASSNSFERAFALCNNLTDISFPKLNTVGISTFSNSFLSDRKLVNASFPSLKILLNNYSFSYAFYNSGLQNIDMSALQTVGDASSNISIGIFQNAFANCYNLTSVTFNKLYYIRGNNTFANAFANCTNLTSVYFPQLLSVTRPTSSAKTSASNAMFNAFSGCTNLTSVKMPRLREISYHGIAFSNTFNCCTNLSYIEFPSLQTINGHTFSNTFNGSGIKNIVFPQATDVTNSAYGSSMLNGVTDCVVHFPASMESTMNTWNSVINGFGGTNTTILYDCYPVSSYYPITENGTMGGDTFAVNASNDSTNAYLAFDGNANTGWQIASTDTPADYVIYTPKAVELTSINVQSIDNNAPTFVNISGSNDGVNWNVMEIIVTTGTNASGRWANFTDPAYYKYYKVVCGAPDEGTMVTINSMDLVGHYIG